MYNVNKLSAIIIDEISMVKPWMLAYLDERLKEATQNFNKPFGGVAVIMFGDFDQQPPIGGSSLPHFSMSLLEREHMKKHRIYFTKRSKREHAEINSTLCCIGARLFESARLLRLSVQHRCENDPRHMANLKKMSAGLKMTTRDLDIYKTLSQQDLTNLDKFLYGTIIVTGNYERQELNAFMATIWAKRFKTHVVRWKRKIKYDRWFGQPRSDELLREAEKQACFYEYFVPHGPAYLTNNLNLLNELANGTLVREHSLAFDNSDDKMHLDEMLQSTPIGGIIDLPAPPTAINVEIFPSFPTDSSETLLHKENKRARCKHGSITDDGTIVIPIDPKAGKYHNESIRASTFPFFYNASKVPMSDHFPIELGFCITVPKAQGRTIHNVTASLSEHPIAFLRFQYEQLYVLLSRISGSNEMRLLLRNGCRDTLNYISKLEKDPFSQYYFAGFGDETTSTPTPWNSTLAAMAAGFISD